MKSSGPSSSSSNSGFIHLKFALIRNGMIDLLIFNNDSYISSLQLCKELNMTSFLDFIDIGENNDFYFSLNYENLDDYKLSLFVKYPILFLCTES